MKLSTNQKANLKHHSKRISIHYFILDSTSGAAIYVLSVVLVIVIAAIFVAAVMIHKKSRVSESHFFILISKNDRGNDSLNSFFRFHSWKQKKYKVKRSQLEMLVPLSVPSAVKKQDFTTVNQGQILLVDHWDFSTTIFILLK